MKHISPKGALRMCSTYIRNHLQSFAARLRRIVPQLAMLALILSLAFWSNFASVSGGKDAYADVSPPWDSLHPKSHNKVLAQQSTKTMTLDPLEPSCVEENGSLRITVRINEPLTSDEADLEGRMIRGGVIIFDPADAPQFAEVLSAFVFREGQETANAAGHTVRPGNGKDRPQNNPSWPSTMFFGV